MRFFLGINETKQAQHKHIRTKHTCIAPFLLSLALLCVALFCITTSDHFTYTLNTVVSDLTFASLSFVI